MTWCFTSRTFLKASYTSHNGRPPGVVSLPVLGLRKASETFLCQRNYVLFSQSAQRGPMKLSGEWFSVSLRWMQALTCYLCSQGTSGHRTFVVRSEGKREQPPAGRRELGCKRLELRGRLDPQLWKPLLRGLWSVILDVRPHR